MLKNLLICLVTVALVTASAATYRVTLFQPSVVNGTELAPGDYKLELKDTQIVLSKGKATAQANVRVETAEAKFSSTSVRYTNGDGKFKIQEIRLGGTNTKLVFTN